MKKIRLFSPLLLATCAGIVPAIVCTSCNRNKVELTVEHGEAEVSEVKINENFTIKYIPEEGWTFDSDNSEIWVGGQKLTKGEGWGASQDPINPKNTKITVFGPYVKSTNVKIVIKAMIDTYHVFYYDHQLEITKDYFSWDSTNPTKLSKDINSITVKITKNKEYTTEFKNPIIAVDSTLSVSPSSVSLADMKVGDTKEVTFSWTGTTIAFAFVVKVDNIIIETKKSGSFTDAFQFIDLPSVINRVNKTLPIKCKFTDISHFKSATPILECVFNNGAGETQILYVDVKIGEQIIDLNWTEDNIFKIDITFKPNKTL